MFLPKTLIESILSDDLATNFDQAHHGIYFVFSLT